MISISSLKHWQTDRQAVKWISSFTFLKLFLGSLWFPTEVTEHKRYLWRFEQNLAIKIISYIYKFSFYINLIEIHACIKKLLHKKKALKHTVKHKFSSMAISSWDKEVLDNFFKSIASNSSHILFGKPFSFWENPTFQFHAIFCGVDLTEESVFIT